jgi:hypothetical protein
VEWQWGLTMDSQAIAALANTSWVIVTFGDAF